MPSTLWSAPVAIGNSAPLVQSSISAAVLDITPPGCIIPAGYLNLGTRVRITAWGSYIATTTASTMAFGFYMGNVGALITAPAVTLTLGPAVTAVATTMPWMLEYWGLIAAVSTTSTTSGSIVGRGRFTSNITSWVTVETTNIAPQAVASQTQAQTAAGMNTSVEQTVLVGCTVTTATGITSITTNELTCELLG
jgi:hypothetical protein